MMSNVIKHRRLAGVILAALVLLAASAGAADPGQATAHSGVDCRLCHLRSASGASAGGNASTAACRSCHGAHPASTRALATWFHQVRGGGADAPDCVRCHAFHAPDAVATPLGSLSLASLRTVDAAHCRSCHGPGHDLAQVSDAHREAARLYHEDAKRLAGLSPSEGCLGCHSGNKASFWRERGAETGPRFDEHASHPFGIAVRAGQTIPGSRLRADLDSRLPLPAGRLECQTCHLLTATTRDLLIPFDPPRDLCLGCHQFASPGVPSPQVAQAGF